MLGFMYEWDGIRIVLVQWLYNVPIVAHQMAAGAPADFKAPTKQDWVPPPGGEERRCR